MVVSIRECSPDVFLIVEINMAIGVQSTSIPASAVRR
jgi:hypothetical protein